MLPAPFEYHAPKTMDEALGLLDELGEDAKVLAGGQSLIPLLKLRFASPGHLVDWGTVLLRLDADLVLRSKSGSRTVKARDFFSGPFSTALQPTEILSEIRIPVSKAMTGGSSLKLERKVGDFATVAVAVHLRMDDGKVGSAGIGLTAVGPQNIKAEKAEASLKGVRLDDAAIKQAAALAAEAADPKADHRGSVEYKRNLVRVFTERGLKRASERARGGG